MVRRKKQTSELGPDPLFITGVPEVVAPEPTLDLRTVPAREKPEVKPASSSAPQCPDCGSRFSDVDRTRPCGRGTQRWRICVHCRRQFVTREIVPDQA